MMGYDEELDTDVFPVPADVAPALTRCFNEIRGWCYREMGQPWFIADAFAHWAVSAHPPTALRYGQLRRLFVDFEANVNGAYSYRMAHSSRLIGDGWSFPHPIRLS